MKILSNLVKNLQVDLVRDLDLTDLFQMEFNMAVFLQSCTLYTLFLFEKSHLIVKPICL